MTMEPGRRCLVLQTFEPENHDEIHLNSGEIVELVCQDSDLWWKGRVGDREGIFPINFVKLLEEPSIVEAEEKRPDVGKPNPEVKKAPLGKGIMAINMEDLSRGRLRKTEKTEDPSSPSATPAAAAPAKESAVSSSPFVSQPKTPSGAASGPPPAAPKKPVFPKSTSSSSVITPKLDKPTPASSVQERPTPTPSVPERPTPTPSVPERPMSAPSLPDRPILSAFAPDKLTPAPSVQEKPQDTSVSVAQDMCVADRASMFQKTSGGGGPEKPSLVPKKSLPPKPAPPKDTRSLRSSPDSPLDLGVESLTKVESSVSLPLPDKKESLSDAANRQVDLPGIFSPPTHAPLSSYERAKGPSRAVPAKYQRSSMAVPDCVSIPDNLSNARRMSDGSFEEILRSTSKAVTTPSPPAASQSEKEKPQRVVLPVSEELHPASVVTLEQRLSDIEVNVAKLMERFDSFEAHISRKTNEIIALIEDSQRMNIALRSKLDDLVNHVSLQK